MGGFHGYCREAMFSLPLSLMMRVGVLFPSLGGGASFYIQCIELAKPQIIQICRQSSTEPPNKDIEGPWWPFLVFLATSPANPSHVPLEPGVGNGVPKGFQEVPPRHAHGDLTSLAPHERLPEILVVPQEKTPTGAAARGCSRVMVGESGL